MKKYSYLTCLDYKICNIGMLLSSVISLIVDLAIKNMQVMSNSAEKVRLAGNPNVMVCERGTMFGYSKSAQFLSQMTHAICLKVLFVSYYHSTV